jgi:hypothetical protein
MMGSRTLYPDLYLFIISECVYYMLKYDLSYTSLSLLIKRKDERFDIIIGPMDDEQSRRISDGVLNVFVSHTFAKRITVSWKCKLVEIICLAASRER